ncbi:Carbohydrate sulfotransferase 11 [Armadillidium vulgare]|nr:Carbohydrate sulfotransferase 11 [Armadillidium vulgare]
MEECLKIIDAGYQFIYGISGIHIPIVCECTNINGRILRTPFPTEEFNITFSVKENDIKNETKYTVKFMLVRHPFERLISAYRDKFENATQKYFYQLYGESMVKRLKGSVTFHKKWEVISRFLFHATIDNFLGKLQREVSLFISNKRPISSGNPFANPIGPTFEEFVKFVLSYPTNDDHWRPYYIQCSLCHMDYHYVMRLICIVVGVTEPLSETYDINYYRFIVMKPPVAFH